ncbi:MAG TPA: alpha/beta fold hydrolase [bacterium]|nr:alpha/beta fold hydrolase [bacterium]
MPEQAVSIRAADGSALRGLWRSPAGAGPFPCVVCIPGLTLTKAMFDLSAMLLERHGVASLRLDLRGHGNSDARLQDQGFEDQLSDVRAAFEGLAGLPGADPDRRGILGFSMGGAMAALAAAALPVKALALWSPLLKTEPWNGLRKEQYGPAQGDLRPIWDGILVHERLFSEALGHHPLLTASAWPGPLLVCHGGKDRNHPQSASVELAAARCAAALPVASYFPPLSGHRWLAEGERRTRDQLSAAFFEASL